MHQNMKTNRLIKYTLFSFCYVFWVVSGLMLAVGIYAKTVTEAGAVDSLTADPALLLIIVGCLMFCITFIGCIGALRDIQILLRIFMWTLLIILVLQITGAVLGFVFSGKVLRKSEKLLDKAIIRYRDDLDLQNLIDFIQKKFKCCGIKYYSDWSKNMYFNCSETNPSLERCAVPFSCCIMDTREILNTMCGYETQELKPWSAQNQIYINGCLDSIVKWGHQNLLTISGLALGLLVLEIFMVSLTVLLLHQIQSVKKIIRRTTQK
uniref:Tetraspanin n=2 Tax=Callorhinchus milii TaxID=7868 RepID=A0A4W3IZL6_CALMI|eukprot:gi/632954216/ref/XP_007892842.1/ PREDICTED: tetraspanin-33-like [Callorhinchus milii]